MYIHNDQICLSERTKGRNLKRNQAQKKTRLYLGDTGSVFNVVKVSLEVNFVKVVDRNTEKDFNAGI